MKFKSLLFFSFVSTFAAFTIASANHTDTTSEPATEKKPPLVIKHITRSKKARADLWPMPHGVLTDLPKNMLPAHRPAPKHPIEVPAQ